MVACEMMGLDLGRNNTNYVRITGFNYHKLVGFKATSYFSLARMSDRTVGGKGVLFLGQGTMLSGINTTSDLIPSLWEVTVYLK